MVAEWQEGGAYLMQRTTGEPPLPQTPQVCKAADRYKSSEVAPTSP